MAKLIQLFFDDDGKVYNAWAGIPPGAPFIQGNKVNVSCFATEIDLATGDALGPAQLIRRNGETGNGVSEGPHIFKRGEWYYLITAEGGTEIEHQEFISRSKHPLGPYEAGPENVNPLVYNADHPDIQMTGHMDLIEGADGRWWAFFLAVRNHNGALSQLGRETFLCPVEWVDDWPVVNGGKKVELEGPPILPRVPEEQSWEYGFSPETSESHPATTPADDRSPH